MSGGVDSSVAAYLLREQGHDVIGLFMRHGQEQEQAETCSPGPAAHRQGCCSAADAQDARRVADRLGIPFYALNFEQEFGRVVDYFVAEYRAGRTPNPCIACNAWLKFGKLLEYADSVGAPWIASGHYARLVPQPEGPPALCRAVDSTKDQSYVLFSVRREVLSRMMFPVGGYSKTEIRQIAAKLGLQLADKPDSQEICFVPDRDHIRFVRNHRSGADTSGEIVTTSGEVVGRHEGIEAFTVGQRKGLGIAFGEPRFVVRIDALARRVVIGAKADLAQNGLTARDVNWLVAPPTTAVDCQVKIRYRSRPIDAVAEPLPLGRMAVRFREPCAAVAPGQAVVCYEGDRVLGGGWIE
jgi:tRNA-specific 2-thiouridylase